MYAVQAKFIDQAVSIVTVIAIIVLFATENLLFACLSLEWIAVMFGLAYVSPGTLSTTRFISDVVVKWYWPESRSWLWGTVLAINLIIVVEALEAYAK